MTLHGLARRGRNLLRRWSDRPIFASDDVVIGKNVSFGRGVVFNCRRVRIGDGVRIGDNVRVDAEVFEIGDYGTIYERCFFPGPGEIRIGHNFWMGIDSIVDAMAGTLIQDNVCVGVGSQLWTHMIFGDVLAGCRFHSKKPLVVESDVWFSSRCLVTPIRAGARSLAMMGSLVTKDMAPDHTYAGAPAADVTEKLGPQFQPTSVEWRVEYLRSRLEQFAHSRGRDLLDRLVVARSAEELHAAPADRLVFNVRDRTYTKGRAEFEGALMRFLLPDAKFVPAHRSVAD